MIGFKGFISIVLSLAKLLLKCQFGMHQPRESKQGGYKELILSEQFFYKLRQSFLISEEMISNKLTTESQYIKDLKDVF